ncbi:MAG: sensor histidine kinase [Cyclobacteriaceae bacterium]
MKIRYTSLLLLLFGYLFSNGQIHEPVKEKWMTKEDYVVMLIDSLAFAELEKDSLDVIRYASVLTTAMHGSKIRSRSKYYLEIALRYSSSFSDSKWYSEVCNRVGMFYFANRNLSPLDSSKYLAMNDSSIYWHNQAVKFGKKFSNPITQGWGYRGLMTVYIDLHIKGFNDYSKEITYYFMEIRRISKENEDDELFVHSSQRYCTFLAHEHRDEEISSIVSELQPFLETMNIGQSLSYLNTVHDYIAVKNNLDTLITLKSLLMRKYGENVAATHQEKLHEADQKYEVSKTKSFLEKTERDLADSKAALITSIIVILFIGLISFYLYRLYRKNKLLSSRNELLLKEQNHRVKNNLQMINSLLSLQSQKLLSTDAKEALNESQLRINSVALLHRILYEGEQAGTVNMEDYLKTLSEEISYAVPRRIVTHLQIPNDLDLEIERATSLGLILNELMTNSIKHVSEEIELEIGISIEKDTSGEIILKYSDNGEGIDLHAWNTSKSFGNQLIRLQSEQLRGKYRITDKKGFQYELRMSA